MAQWRAQISLETDIIMFVQLSTESKIISMLHLPIPSPFHLDIFTEATFNFDDSLPGKCGDVAFIVSFLCYSIRV